MPGKVIINRTFVRNTLPQRLWSRISNPEIGTISNKLERRAQGSYFRLNVHETFVSIMESKDQSLDLVDPSTFLSGRLGFAGITRIEIEQGTSAKDLSTMLRTVAGFDVLVARNKLRNLSFEIEIEDRKVEIPFTWDNIYHELVSQGPFKVERTGNWVNEAFGLIGILGGVAWGAGEGGNMNILEGMAVGGALGFFVLPYVFDLGITSAAKIAKWAYRRHHIAMQFDLLSKYTEFDGGEMSTSREVLGLLESFRNPEAVAGYISKLKPFAITVLVDAMIIRGKRQESIGRVLLDHSAVKMSDKERLVERNIIFDRNIGLFMASDQRKTPEEVAKLINKFLTKSIPADEVAPAKYSKEDYQHAAEVINSHPIEKREAILANLILENRDLGNAVEPLVILRNKPR
ncbi:MAG: hypothetical protein KKB81_03100 [Candidatus Margulisbacteria bacterium]|nr:hypothetical protein [Candidatus Margulisiibacteriota bacterium]MBU1022232.1 hypothetical protein [Candidatus Margulisiibacteriota bacterium]MBU1729329.1 hypothetical protein [Candidatus Margulisiibacteriota bacterium]MBU1955602.1 hypothetical protein [Candidatus Margulisiibacteriota bacterium]